VVPNKGDTGRSQRSTDYRLESCIIAVQLSMYMYQFSAQVFYSHAVITLWLAQVGILCQQYRVCNAELHEIRGGVTELFTRTKGLKGSKGHESELDAFCPNRYRITMISTE
jgi:hypothetical protein